MGEELGVLPGMDSMFSALALVRLLGLFGRWAQRNHQKDKFDVIIYDGISTEETLRLIGASSKARFGNNVFSSPSPRGTKNRRNYFLFKMINIQPYDYAQTVLEIPAKSC